MSTPAKGQTSQEALGETVWHFSRGSLDIAEMVEMVGVGDEGGGCFPS